MLSRSLPASRKPRRLLKVISPLLAVSIQQDFSREEGESRLTRRRRHTSAASR
jgi:hypothetical protein